MGTSFAEGIRLTDLQAQYDAACKRLLSEKILLAWIMRACLEEYQGCDVNEIAEKYIEGTPEIGTAAVNPDETNQPKIRGANIEDKTMTEGTVFFDIRFFAIAPSSNELIRLIVNIEAQSRQDLLYALIRRAIFYCCRMISSQYGTEFQTMQYQKIKKVYSVWLCFDSSESCKNSITKYRITEETVIGDVREDKADYDLLTVVIVRLGKAEDVDQVNILRLLNILFSKEISVNEKKRLLEKDFQIPMEQTIERRLDQVCNLSQGVLEHGIAIGRTEGKMEGIAIGEQRMSENAIQAIVQAFHLSREEARALLHLPAEDKSDV